MSFKKCNPVLLAILFAALLVLNVPGFAQELTEVERLEISIWPEFDQAAGLIIYRLTLPSNTPLPAKVNVPIPAAAGEPHAVAVRSATSDLLVAPYEIIPQGDWNIVAVESNQLNIQVEYYQPLELDGAQRSFTFTWPGGISIAALTINVQHPGAAENMLLDPVPDSTNVSGDGLSYYYFNLGSMAADEGYSIGIRYQNASGQLTVELLQPAAPLSRPDEMEGATGGLEPMLIPLIVVAVAMVALGAVLYWRTRNQPKVKVPRKKRRGVREQPAALGGASAFCHNCGKRSSPSDRFCRDCGERLRH